MRIFIHLFLLILVVVSVKGETITLYNDNGRGGIHQSIGKLVVDEGQYFVDLSMPTYNGKTETEHLKVYRVKDSARLLHNQDKWAEKYAYVVERSIGYFSSIPYYFNMKSTWKPSLTEDPDDPDRVIPIKKIVAYQDDFNGGRMAVKVVLIKMQGKYMLYFGDDFFGANIESNSKPLDDAPAWSRKFKYRSKISGFNVYFNITSKR